MFTVLRISLGPDLRVGMGELELGLPVGLELGKCIGLNILRATKKCLLILFICLSLQGKHAIAILTC